MPQLLADGNRSEQKSGEAAIFCEEFKIYKDISKLKQKAQQFKQKTSETPAKTLGFSKSTTYRSFNLMVHSLLSKGQSDLKILGWRITKHVRTVTNIITFIS